MATYTRALDLPGHSPRGTRAVGIEVKASARWRPGDGRPLNEMVASRIVRRGFGVYLGNTALRDERIDVLPLRVFLDRLYEGDVIG